MLRVGPWQDMKEKSELLLARMRRQKRRRRLVELMKKFHLYQYLQEQLPHSAMSFFYLGMYFLGAIYVAMYFVPITFFEDYNTLFSATLVAVVLPFSLLSTYGLWPPPVKTKSVQILLWYGSIFIAFFVVSPLLMFLGQFDHFFMSLMIINVLIAAHILPAPMLFGMLLGGTYLATKIFTSYADAIDGATLAMSYKDAYGFTLVCAAALVVFRT